MDYTTYALNNLSDWIHDALQVCTADQIVDTINKALDDTITYHEDNANVARKIKAAMSKPADPYAPYSDNIDFNYELGNFGSNLFVSSTSQTSSPDVIQF